ncbi:hypothetical protein BDR06DRAFT_964256 [Suillus hirtellus]|nr:hypothetical protein BDR06DRAFT_964256 [Suillus hirtellus]
MYFVNDIHIDVLQKVQSTYDTGIQFAMILLAIAIATSNFHVLQTDNIHTAGLAPRMTTSKEVIWQVLSDLLMIKMITADLSEKPMFQSISQRTEIRTVLKTYAFKPNSSLSSRDDLELFIFGFGHL